MEFVANIKFEGDDEEFERLYNEYRNAKGKLVGYLRSEGVGFGRSEFVRKKEAASGN